MRFRKIEARQTQQAAPEERRSNGARRRRRRAGTFLGVLLVGIFAALIGALLWRHVWIVTTGRVMAKEVRITTVEAGRIAAVLVTQGDDVRAGQALVEMDVSRSETQMEINAKRAEAELALSRAERDALERAGLDPAYSAAVEAAELQLEQALTERRLAETAGRQSGTAAYGEDLAVARERRLLELRATTRKEYEEALARSRRAGGRQPAPSALQLAELDAEIRLAKQRLAQAQARLEFAKGRYKIEFDQRDLSITRAEAEVELARQRLAAGTITAPMDGRIGWVSRYPGDVVDKDDVIVTVLNPSELWIEAYVQTDDLADLDDGDTATVRFAGISGEYFGKVGMIYPEERLEFRNVEVGQQLVRSPSRLSTVYHAVRIDLDAPPPPGLRPDQTVRVRIRRR
ncbi:MAG: HlyD family secretion protein [Chromatiales bacterium]